MKSEKNILLVVNPISGDCDKTDLINLVKNLSETQKFNLELFYTTGNKDLELIKEVISNKKIKRVLVAGGDGTIKLVAEAVENSEIILGILPAGSANGLAVNFKIPEIPQQQAEIALSDCFVEMDMLEINKQTCLHIADMGINAELIKNYEDSSLRGKLGYFIQSIPTIFQSESPYDFTIEANGETFQKTGILLAIANANTFGTGANINPDGKIDDGKFEILVFKNLDFIEIFKTMRENTRPNEEFVDVISTKKARIFSQKPVSFQIDGEYEGKISEINVKIKASKLKVAVPATFCTI